MAFEAKILRVLIASPGDIGEERSVIPELINEWNAINAFNTKILLMPIKWETHSAPLMGGRPQEIINDQIVKDCDLLVGLFWTRIGTNTGVSQSGTVEEIEQFVEMRKPVMLYFSQSPIDPAKIDIDQFAILRNFQEKMRLKGLTESYLSINDFKQKFGRQLGINVNSLIDSIQKDATRNKIHDVKKVKNIKSVIQPIIDEGGKLTDEEINEYLIKAYHSVAREDGWAYLAGIGSYLRTYTPIDYRSFKFQTLKKFLISRNLFEVRVEKKSPHAKEIDSAYVRLQSNIKNT